MTDPINPELEKPVLCGYKGVDRTVRKEVCLWHVERKDPECERCEEAKKLRSQEANQRRSLAVS